MTNREYIDYLRYIITLCTGFVIIAAFFERWGIVGALILLIVVSRVLVAELHKDTRKVLNRQRERLELRMKAEQAEMERAHMELLSSQVRRISNDG